MKKIAITIGLIALIPIILLLAIRMTSFEFAHLVHTSNSPDGRYRCDIYDRDHNRSQFTYSFETFSTTNGYSLPTYGTRMTLYNDSVPIDEIELRWTNDTLHVSMGSLSNYMGRFERRQVWWTKN